MRGVPEGPLLGAPEGFRALGFFRVRGRSAWSRESPFRVQKGFRV